MSFNLDGFVLRGATSAQSNAKATAKATSGIVRDIKPLPSSYDLSSIAPPAIDLDADQYRASVLQSPIKSTSEYLLWAANTGNISTVEGDPSDGSDPYLITDEYSAEFASSGLAILFLNEKGKAISSVFAVGVKHGTTGVKYLLTYNSSATNIEINADDPPVILQGAFSKVDFDGGILTIDQTVLDTYFGGSFDPDTRGDTIYRGNYFLSPIKFWWSRNDVYEKRFKFDDRVQAYRPLKGTPTLSIGILAIGAVYTMSPIPNGLVVGDYLPGNSSQTDNYSMIRLGRLPNSGSYPVAESTLDAFTGALIVPDEEVTDTYNFSAHSPPPAAIVGVTSGQIFFNPLFAMLKAGQNIWYSYRSFVEDATGFVGELENAEIRPLFIAPIPQVGQRPFIKVGSRSYLSPIIVKTDADLSSTNLTTEKEVGVSLATGKLKFHSSLIDKSKKDNENFNPHFLGAIVYYDGVSLNEIPQPLKAPTPLYNASGAVVEGVTPSINRNIYVPLANPYGSNGLGVSGILHGPDGTGAPFDLTATTGGDAKMGIRPGGDNLTDPASGLIRRVRAMSLGQKSPLTIGDAFIFTSQGRITLQVVQKEESEELSDLSSFPFRVKGGKAEITREGIVDLGGDLGFGSMVLLSQFAMDTMGSSERVYFIQTTFKPSHYTNKARLTSRIRDLFTFTVGDLLVFSVNGTAYTWTASLVEYKVKDLVVDVLANSQNLSTGQNTLSGENIEIYEQGGHLIMEADTSIEIGFGNNNIKDLSGCANMGFNPGWRAVSGQDNWLSDTGMSFGVSRSIFNRTGQRDFPDFRAIYRFNDRRVSPSDGLKPQPLLFLDQSPLEDIAGYDEGVFFNSRYLLKIGFAVVPVVKPLKHYEDIIHRFGERYFFG